MLFTHHIRRNTGGPRKLLGVPRGSAVSWRLEEVSRVPVDLGCCCGFSGDFEELRGSGIVGRPGTRSHFLNIPINIREANYNTWSFKFDNFSEFQNVISNRSPASLPPTPEHYYDPQSTKINIWLTPNHKDIILNRRNNW